MCIRYLPEYLVIPFVRRCLMGNVASNPLGLSGFLVFALRCCYASVVVEPREDCSGYSLKLHSSRDLNIQPSAFTLFFAVSTVFRELYWSRSMTRFRISCTIYRQRFRILRRLVWQVDRGSVPSAVNTASYTCPAETMKMKVQRYENCLVK